MTEYYTATWIPTGEKLRTTENSLQNAWEWAIECFKEKIMVELKPTTFINPDTGEATPTFKMLLITNYIKVERERCFYVTVYQNLQAPEVSTYSIESVMENGFEVLNLPKGVTLWLADWMINGKLSFFSYKYVDSVKGEIMVDIAYR